VHADDVRFRKLFRMNLGYRRIVDSADPQTRETSAMADPNDPFPDMSLPDRNEPAPSWQPKPPPGQSVPASRGRAWRVGDRALAPWEPIFRYVGRIDELRDGRAFICFDDGDSGWFAVDALLPFELTIGQTLHVRRDNQNAYYPAELLEWDGDEIRVAFEDGGQEWHPVARMRIFQEEMAALLDRPPVTPGSLRNAKTGDRVWAPWEANVLFVGVIEQVERFEAHVAFGSGQRGWVRIEQLAPYEKPLGLRVFARRSQGQYAVTTIDQVDGERIRVLYDNGDREWTTPDALACPCEPSGPPARPSGVGSNMPTPSRQRPLPVAPLSQPAPPAPAQQSWGWLGWLIVIGVSILIRVLIASTRH
jgi:hypothetical protein